MSPEGISGTIAVRPLAGLAAAGASRGVPHRPDRPGHVHPPARLLGAGLPGAGRRDLPAPHGPAVDPRRRPRERAHRSHAGSGSVRSSGIGSASMPSSSAPTAASGSRSATGKTGDSTGRRAIATCSGRPTRSSSARSCRFPACRAREAVAVWLAPPGDMARPVWRDVLEQIQLGPEEQAACLAPGRPGGPPHASALGPDRGQGGRASPLAGGRRPAPVPGRPGDRRRMRTPARLRDLASPNEPICRPSRSPTPRASSSRWRAATPSHAAGIDIEPVREMSESPIPPPDRGAFACCPPGRTTSRCEWIARFRAARQAAAKAGGLGPAADPGLMPEVVKADARFRRCLRRVPRRPRIGTAGPRPGRPSGSGRPGGTITSGHGPWEKRR